MRTRMLFFVGIVLLMLALGGLVLRFTRLFPRETLTSGVSGEALLPPTQTPTRTPVPTDTPTLTPTDTLTPVPTSTPVIIVVTPMPLPTTLTAPPAQEEAQAYIVAADDWLSKLADKYLGHPMAYPAIVEYTNQKHAEDASYAEITDPDLIEVGWKIYIPSAEEAYQAAMASVEEEEYRAAMATAVEEYRAAMATAAALLTPTILTPLPPTPTRTPTGTLPPPTGTLPPTPMPLPTAMIEAEWPKKMEFDCSDSIRVSLVRTTDQVFVPTIEIASHTVIAESPIPVGTPGPLVGAWGPEYKACAIANLAGGAFKISPVTTECQSLEQPRITWEWNIMSEKPGPQTINASIQVQWEPIGGDGETIQRTIWRSRFDILVEKPLMTVGQLNIFSLFNGFVGSALSAPWLYERIKERKEKRQKDEESKPKIYLS